MDFTKAVLLADKLVDSEFDQFNNNPKGYIESMGWDSKNGKFASIDKLKGQLIPTPEDIINLRKIILSIDTEDVIEATENNTVTDYLNNCVAGRILEKIN